MFYHRSIAGKRIAARDASEDAGVTGIKTVDAVGALADHLGITFTKLHHGWITASGGRKAISAPLYKDGVPVDIRDPFTNAVVPILNTFTVDEGMWAIAATLGLEFRAEYVVGSNEPQLKAVKKPKASK